MRYEREQAVRDWKEQARLELAMLLMRFHGVDEDIAAGLAAEMVQKADWENLALMQKGLSWMAKNYQPE